ncbi:MipA/OmpV family protein [Enterovibrio calviensis]|uniref:MipA/OmpV family protein n=1 Tax=Enterovibrio calviensis TaxID=91359 RepID=UPI00048A019B|nr:MipA/OmpV family protein [Enterovibrio calviensis]
MMKFGLAPMSGLTLLVLSMNVAANDKYDDYGFVGGSVTVGESVFSNDGTSGGVEPNIFYNGEYGFIDGSLLNYAVLPWVGISGQWRFAEVSDDFDDIPNGINDRDGNGELGVTIGSVGARLTYLHDVTDEHNGYEVQLHLGRAFDTPFEQFTLSPYVEVDYRDAKLSNHLYSVSANESRTSGLDSFNAGSTWVYKSGLIGIYDFSEEFIGLSKLELEHHDSDSPLVQQDLGWQFSIGAAYKF